MANVVTCDALAGLVLDIISRQASDIADVLGVNDYTYDFSLKTETDPNSPTGKKYTIVLKVTAPDGTEVEKTVPLDTILKDIFDNEKYVTNGRENHTITADGEVTNTKIILNRSSGLPDVEIDLQNLITALKKDIKDNQDKYVNGGELTTQVDPTTGKPTQGKIVLTVKNGDNVEINITDLLSKLTGYVDGADAYLVGVDKSIERGANGKFESVKLKFNVKGKDPITVDITELIDEVIEARKVVLHRYYPTIMFNRGKLDSCTRFTTERIGWIYHKDDERPEDANVEMIDESTPYNILGYAYGTSTPDHNIPIQYTEPDGDVVTVGYAANSPLMLVEE